MKVLTRDKGEKGYSLAMQVEEKVLITKPFDNPSFKMLDALVIQEAAKTHIVLRPKNKIEEILITTD